MKDFVHRFLVRGAHLYWWASRGLTLGVRGIVLDGDHRVCLVRHTYVPGWHFPGGGVEAGETALTALARELREEAEIVLDAQAPPTLHGIFHSRAVTQRDHVLAYVVRAFTHPRAKVPDREIAEARFFPLDGLPDGTTEAVHRRLHELARGAPPNSAW